MKKTAILIRAYKMAYFTNPLFHLTEGIFLSPKKELIG